MTQQSPRSDRPDPPTKQQPESSGESVNDANLLVGGVFVVTGLAFLCTGLLARHRIGFAGVGLVLLVIGVRSGLRALRARRIRATGIPLTARVMGVELTGTRYNHVPVYRLTLEVNGPCGRYTANMDKLVPEHEVGALIGAELRVRANAHRLEEVTEE
jgi:hypothetical protein